MRDSRSKSTEDQGTESLHFPNITVNFEIKENRNFYEYFSLLKIYMYSSRVIYYTENTLKIVMNNIFTISLLLLLGVVRSQNKMLTEIVTHRRHR